MNLPNILSVIRILLIPVNAILFSKDCIAGAVTVFIIACLTDILDGYIARKYNLITDLGKILDPLADKGMQITMLISMAFCDLMPWFVVMFIFMKELLMCVGGAVLYRSHTVVGANSYGKIATVVTSSCVILILVFHPFLNNEAIFTLQWAPVAFAVYAFIRYTMLFTKIKKSERE